MLSILLPMLGTARESARRLQCTNHLKQIGLALHRYHEIHGSLPSAWEWDRYQKTAFGWIPPLLPCLEQAPVAAKFDHGSPLDDSFFQRGRTLTLPFVLCPSDMLQPTFVLYEEPERDELPADVPLIRLPAGSYLGVFGVAEPDDVWRLQAGEGAFSGARPISFQEMTRGVSQVLLVGERRASTIPSTWLGIDIRGEDAHCRILGNANLGPNYPHADECEFTSRHPGSVNFLWADGRVKALGNTIDQRVYQQMACRSEF